MSLSAHIRRLSHYNAWANRHLLDACRRVAQDAQDAYYLDRGAFFGSLHGTLNHILVVDRLWLARIADTDAGNVALDAIACPDLDALETARGQEDDRIIALADHLDDAALDQPLDYRTVAGVSQRTSYGWVLLHMLNHATHHRGQAHALLSQVPSDPPSLDLIRYLRECGPWERGNV